MPTRDLLAIIVIWFASLSASDARAQVSLLDSGYYGGSPDFGREVGFVGDILLIAAPGLDDRRENEGAVFTYEHDGIDWAPKHVLRPLPAANVIWYGSQIETTEERVAIAGYSSIDVFRREVDSSWTREFTESREGFQIAAFSSEYLALRRNSESDSLVMFFRSELEWSRDDTIFRQDTDASAFRLQTNFKAACFIGDDFIVADYSDSQFQGAVRVFRRQNGKWEYVQKIDPPSQPVEGSFGRRVACHNDRFVVRNGQLEFFTYATNWTGEWDLLHSFSLPRLDRVSFLIEPAIYGEYLVAGDPFGNSNRGVVWIYRDDGMGYRYIRKLSTPRPPTYGTFDGDFGWDVAVNRNFLVAGAPERDLLGPDSVWYSSGEAYVFGLGTVDRVPRPAVLEPRHELTWTRVYPNPGRGSQRLVYSIPVETNISIEIFDTIGRLVDRISNPRRRPGEHTVDLDTSQWATGVYFVTIRIANGSGHTQTFVVN